MKWRAIFLSIVVLFWATGFGQNKTENIEDCKIAFCINAHKVTEVSLSDTSVINRIESFIYELETFDTFFKKNGYVRLVFHSRIKPIGETPTKCFSISPSYYYFYGDDSTKKFPLFYTRIHGRLVLIYTDIIHYRSLSQKSKKRLSKMVNRTLPKPQYMEFVKEDGKRVKLKPTGHISIDKEKVFCY